MEKLLVQIKVGDEIFSEIMTRDEVIRMLEVNVSADYIDDIHAWDVSEFGKVEEIDIINIYCRELFGIASLSDSDYYEGRE